MYITRLYDFLTRLGADNDRAWFAANRAEYDELRALWLADVDRLIAAMAQWEPSVGSQTAAKAAFRIYRDTRFSPDKRPFKTFFSAAFGPHGRSSGYAGYYLQVGPGCVAGDYGAGLYGGIWCPESAVLRKIRRAIVDNEEEFGEIINDRRLQRCFPEWAGASLKRPPKGFSESDPHIEVLKLKDIGRCRRLGREYFEDPDWPLKAAEDFSAHKPLIDFINYSIDE